MNIPKAIELSEAAERSLRTHKFIDHANAVALGREALKSHQKAIAAGWFPPGYKLPGETDE